MKVVTITQRKGGNGKSTLTLNFAHALAKYHGQKVLIIDTDDQRNTTSAIPTKRPAASTIENLLFDQYTAIEDAAEETLWEGVDLIVGSRNLSTASATLDNLAGSHQRLLAKLVYSQRYDVCLIDTSPSLNMLTINAMCASHGIIIPLASTYFSLEGLAQTLYAYRRIQESLRHDLKLYGAAFVIHDGRTRLARDVQEKVKEQYPGLLCETAVVRSVKIEEAQCAKQSIFSYAPSNRAAAQYRDLADELAERMKQ